jgi:hypothetical protein
VVVVGGKKSKIEEHLYLWKWNKIFKKDFSLKEARGRELLCEGKSVKRKKEKVFGARKKKKKKNSYVV